MTAALPTFDTLLEMARQDPEGLERLRRRLCEQVIRRIPEDSPREERLRRLLWRIEAERRRARTPMAACLHINTMMLDALFRLNAAFNEPLPATPAPAAQILPFPAR